MGKIQAKSIFRFVPLIGDLGRFLWAFTLIIKHHETLSKMLMSPSAYFPLTEQQVTMPLKDPRATNHFRPEVQRPMLQETLKVVKDHGSEWLSFPKLFGIGADPRYRSSFWYSVLKALEIPVMLPPEREKESRSVQNFYVHGQNLHTLVCKDRAGLVRWAENWNLKKTKLLNDIKRVATSPQSSLLSEEANPTFFSSMPKYIFSIRIPVNNVIAERQFNLSQLYLQNNMSDLSKQTSISFVENILHSGKNNNRTTEAAREIYEERMKAYANMLTSDLMQETRK